MPDYLAILRQESTPALGCTEPIAAALATARACEALGELPRRIDLCVSPNILKNAMNVVIPGTSERGLKMAAALAAVAGRSELGLQVLREAKEADIQQAYDLQKSVHLSVSGPEKALYIQARVSGGAGGAECIIEDAHTRITRVSRNGHILFQLQNESDSSGTEPGKYGLTVEGIYAFAESVPLADLEMLKAGLSMNRAIALEGLRSNYGLRIGKCLRQDSPDYAVSLTAAAVDARMGGCSMPVMTLAGSGNQGLCATLPCLAMAETMKASEEKLLRAEAISQLITIHIKEYIGKLSALCGCAIAASVGSACGMAYLMGGGLSEIRFTIQNMIAAVTGMICDGAKGGCALKIASGVAAALQCARLSLAGCTADAFDGIVMQDAKQSIANLGLLSERCTRETDQVILEMMLEKS